jgi:hypothetical protein
MAILWRVVLAKPRGVFRQCQRIGLLSYHEGTAQIRKIQH